MFRTVQRFFAPVAAKPHLVNDPKRLLKLQWSVFLSSTIGYGLYYVCRQSINVIKPLMLADGVFTTDEFGIIGFAFYIAYAVGKFTNGFIADRMNIHRFMTLGMLVSAIINLLLGFYHTLWFFVVLWAINGWVQSIGSPCSVVALSRWMNNRQKGTFFGFGSINHNIGEGLTNFAIAAIIGTYGWFWGFESAGVIGLLGAALLFFFFFDSPQSKGLVPVMDPKESDASVNAMQWSVLKNPAIWVLALSSACMYICRYAINSWGILFLENSKGYTHLEASNMIGLGMLLGIFGTLLSGWVSDIFFKSSRNIPALICGISNTLALSLLLFTPAGHPVLDMVAIILFGIAIGALVCYLGGLIAIDIAPKKAAGAAVGVVGIASYAAAGLQDLINGYVLENTKTVIDNQFVYDFNTIRYFWVGAALLSTILCATLWKVKRH